MPEQTRTYRAKLANLKAVVRDAMNDSAHDAADWSFNLNRFQANPVLLYGHDRDSTIGHWKDVAMVGDDLYGEFQLNNYYLNEQVKDKDLRGVSIGAVLHYDTKTVELLEASLVSIPKFEDTLILNKNTGSTIHSKPVHFDFKIENTMSTPNTNTGAVTTPQPEQVQPVATVANTAPQAPQTQAPPTATPPADVAGGSDATVQIQNQLAEVTKYIANEKKAKREDMEAKAKAFYARLHTAKLVDSKEMPADFIASYQSSTTRTLLDNQLTEAETPVQKNSPELNNLKNSHPTDTGSVGGAIDWSEVFAQADSIENSQEFTDTKATQIAELGKRLTQNAQIIESKRVLDNERAGRGLKPFIDQDHVTVKESLAKRIAQ